jgi:hypothetical protein
MYLVAMVLVDTIVKGNPSSLQNDAKIMLFLCHYCHDNLKVVYFTVKNLLILWTNLKKIFDY